MEAHAVHAGATLVGFAIGGRIRSEVDWTGLVRALAEMLKLALLSTAQTGLVCLHSTIDTTDNSHHTNIQGCSVVK
jgi:hypothetical protein